MLPICGPGCALVTAEGAGRGEGGRGCCSRGVFAPTLTGTPPSLWALYLLPLPHSEKSVDWGWGVGSWPWLAALVPLEEVSGLRKFDSGPGGGRDESDCSRSLPLVCPSRE